MASKSEASRRMDEVVAHFKPYFKQREFRVRGRTFNHLTSEGLTHVIQFQMGRFDPPGTVEIKGMRENLYGRFTVNVSVYVPEVARSRPGLGEASGFVHENDCCIRERLGLLGPESQDLWWLVNGGEPLLAELERRFERDALPFLTRLETRQGVLAELGSPGYRGSEAWRAPTLCAIILGERGERVEAQRLLNMQAKVRPDQDEYFRRLSEQFGLGELAS